MTQENQYDLIITDHEMPLMKGAAFVSAIRTRQNLNKKTPVIMISAFINDEMKKRLHLKEIDFMHKPFSEEELIHLMRKYLNS